SRGIFFAGCAEGPKDIKESVTQASAAAARAMRLMNPGMLTVEAITAEVNPELCNACGLCAKACPYNAISVDTKAKTAAKVTEAACAGCGTCAAECPTSAITMNHFTDAQIEAQIDAILEEDSAERILVFACNWCSYAGADFAGVSRLRYPPHTRLIRTMCSGRIHEKFIWRAFEKGAPVVLVSGCHIGDCHYINANHWTERRVKRVWKKKVLPPRKLKRPCKSLRGIVRANRKGDHGTHSREYKSDHLNPISHFSYFYIYGGLGNLSSRKENQPFITPTYCSASGCIVK
ncbi:MAG: hydrogenase iron-sulfur subunit, partial [Deltaproteobacteria bacterium]|nr:hydrogenase iron-sulfur subunit [Deltaproteobacteria bacterium]